MRNFILVLFVCFSSILSAQKISCKILAKTDQSVVQYVNVGVVNQNIGTTSNSEGNFMLDVTNAISTDTLRISCIGFKTMNISVSEFRKYDGKELVLEPQIYTLREAVINPRRIKQKKLGITSFSPKMQAGFTDNLLGYEMGILMENKKTAKINKINFNIGSCTYDTIFYRINIYEVSKNKNVNFENILTSPIYINIPKEKTAKTVSVDVSNKDIYVNGNFLVTIEHVKDLKKGQLYFSCGLGKSTYHRKTSQGTWKKTPIAIAINVDADVEY